MITPDELMRSLETTIMVSMYEWLNEKITDQQFIDKCSDAARYIIDEVKKDEQGITFERTPP